MPSSSAMATKGFLEGVPLRRVKLQDRCPFTPAGLALGNGNTPLEVLVATGDSRPRLEALRSTWKYRKADRAAPLLVVVLYDQKASVCGPAGEDAPAVVDLDPGQVERVCREALDQPDRHSAQRALRDTLPALESELSGIRNQGFLATHELLVGAPRRTDWKETGDKARRILNSHGEKLLQVLGFAVSPYDSATSVLVAQDRKRALAVLLNQSEFPDIRSDRFSGLTPVSYALSVADRENLPYVIVTQGFKIRIFPTRVGAGVGRRGRAETYVECHTGLLRDSDAAYLWLLFSAEALADKGSLEQLLEDSKRFSGSLAENLRERIYNTVVPSLAKGIAEARALTKPRATDLRDTYDMAMLLLFRLLFVAYGEDKDLLPYKWNGLYRRRSLKKKADELLQIARSGTAFEVASHSLWEETQRIFRAVDEGNREWGVPAYNGGLFSQVANVSRIGTLLAEISLPNTVLGPALRDLLTIPGPEGLGPVDFRSLGVREFGTVYEGLLESELSVADADLAVDKQGVYRPCRCGDDRVVREGEVYLRNNSGARKASGSYFTKAFAVEHLLDQSLEPSLVEHFERIDQVPDDEAAERLFDFRVADIAMGSGHFLIAAIDRIERAFTGYLARRKLPLLADELRRLRESAEEALQGLAPQAEIEDTQLLRRLIAKRCIYGVDLNPTAVQLARLAIWIHTFVPGLPLSLLDRNFVCGNSLVGIGCLTELREKMEEDSLAMFPLDADTLLGDAAEPLKKLALIADTTAAKVREARKAWASAQGIVEPARALCDLTTACLTQRKPFPFDLKTVEELKDVVVGSPDHAEALEKIGDLDPVHFPIAFPEVFLRERDGFDVIVGNPPWEEATLEEDAFWARNYPGLRSLPQREQESRKKELRKDRPDLVELYERELKKASSMRTALTCGIYPGMGTGDPDVYKAFCWRFWRLLAPTGGRIGVVLPRSALGAKGSTEFRLEVLREAASVDVTMLLNNRQWFFEDVHPQYTIGLVAIEKREAERTKVSLRGPYRNLESYDARVKKSPSVFRGDEVLSWNDTASLPLLPTEESLAVFAQLRKAQRLDLNDGRTWRARPYSELHATNDKKHMDLKSKDLPEGSWPVFKGESFDLWTPDTGTYYSWANPDVMLSVLQGKRARSGRNRRSPFSEFAASWIGDPRTLPCHKPRIAFRDITNRTNRRTMIAALVPPNVFLANQAPSLLWPRGAEGDEAYLLGILSSIPLDWYARRFVETHVNYFILNPLPVPRVDTSSPLHERVVALAGRLACPDKRYKGWAESVGVECGPLGEDEKQDMIRELDAVVAHLYPTFRGLPF